jgi:molecular chaperone GrpE
MPEDARTSVEEESVTEKISTEASPTEESVPESGKEPDNHREKWQRAVAEMENMRKRFESDRITHNKYALDSFIEELLPVVDNFYRATEHVPAELQNSAWVTGIMYIQKNLLDVLEHRGVKEIVANPGDSFDPAKHEAISAAEGSAFNEHQVAEIKNKGYMLHDRVLRPTQVTVGAATPSEETEK